MSKTMVAEKPQTRKQYDPGTPGSIEKVGTIYLVASWRGGEAPYTVNLQSPSCSCPHYQNRLKEQGNGEECKHLAQVRAHVAARRQQIARTLTNDELIRARRVFESAGRFDEAFILLAEQHDRQQAAA